MKNGQFLMLIAFACVLLMLFGGLSTDAKAACAIAATYLGMTGLAAMRADE